jgi:hypothetical protein
MRSSVRIIRAKELLHPFVQQHSNTVGSTPSEQSGNFIHNKSMLPDSECGNEKNPLATPEATPFLSSYSKR